MAEDGDKCPGCAVETTPVDGPVHRYIGASPGCWAVYGRLLAGEPSLAPRPRGPLLVDAYAAQHPGGESPQATQSAAVHVIVLHAAIDRGQRLDRLVALRSAAVAWGRASGGYPPLRPVPATWELTIHDLVAATTEARRSDLANQYPDAVRNGWMSIHGEQIAEWYGAVVP